MSVRALTLFTVLVMASSAFAQSASSPLPSSSVKPSGSAPPTTPGAALTANEVAANVQRAYDSIQAFESDFDQQYSMRAFGQTKTSKGHVIFVKPGKMRWNYTEPKDNVVVSDGSTLWSYVASDKQARKMPIKDSQMPTALSFLTGKGNLTQEFDVKLLDSAKHRFEKGYVLEARPKVATNLYAFVLFYIDAQTWHVRRVLIVDEQDNRNRFDFTNAVVNGKVDEKIFRWEPPAGVTVTAN